jgi:hypothetical protein
MADHVGWRAFWWMNVAMIALSIIMVIFMFPETRWNRASGLEQTADRSPATTSSIENEKAVLENEKNGADIDHVLTQTSTNQNGLTEVETAARDPYLGKGTPSKAQWRLFQPNRHPFKSIALDLWIPWKLFAFPIVEFAAFVVSWSCSSFLTINLTQSQALAAPPYNFNSQTIGFTNFAILVGAGIGLATAGPFSDWVSDRATRKNGGIREPEMRLVAMIPYMAIMYLGERHLT